MKQLSVALNVIFQSYHRILTGLKTVMWNLLGVLGAVGPSVPWFTTLQVQNSQNQEIWMVARNLQFFVPRRLKLWEEELHDLKKKYRSLHYTGWENYNNKILVVRIIIYIWHLNECYITSVNNVHGVVSWKLLIILLQQYFV